MKLLEVYLKKNNSNMNQMHIITGLPKTTILNINKKPLDKWTVKQVDAVSMTVRKDRDSVLSELEEIKNSNEQFLGKYDLQQRRYIGSKSKIIDWIRELSEKYVSGNSFFDVFAGTGIVAREFMRDYDEIIINDFLYSNNIIYKAFFGTENYEFQKLIRIKNEFNEITERTYDDLYLETNYGDKYFSKYDAMIIGEIRERIERINNINSREKAILIASLLYSCDSIANTVGHYDAYRKTNEIENRFVFELINPISEKPKKVSIYRNDANELVRKIKADVAFIDPPYNSRQYSRFYHVLEGITKWNKPELTGVAMKPPLENMSDYSKVSAAEKFNDLVSNLDVKYIIVTYNNTYKPKSSSSKNKITHEQIIESLNKIGFTQQFEKPFRFFNTGKTDLLDHKEFVFITEVGVFKDDVIIEEGQ